MPGAAIAFQERSAQKPVWGTTTTGSPVAIADSTLE
jgi:hypothetical protein